MRLHWIFILASGAVLVTSPTRSHAQIPYDARSGEIAYTGQYSRGQDVVPSFDGWKPNPDGTFTLYFGYLNRNYQEELDIPIGPDNNVDGGDRTQPTHFYPRRNWFVFKVVVPKDWGPERKVVWTLNNRGQTHTAKGWLAPIWEMNDEVMMENWGGSVDPENESPVITGTGPQTITLKDTVILTATALDDARPKPRRQRNPEESAAQGLSVRWIFYRGPGPVTFDPITRASAYGTPVTATTKARFKVPGVYVLRAIASDSLLEVVHDVTVTVKE